VLLHKIAEQLKSSPTSASERVESLLLEVKDMQRQLALVQTQKLAGLIPKILKTVSSVGSYKVLTQEIADASSIEGLRDLAIKLREELSSESCVVALAASIESKPVIIVTVNQLAQKQGAKAGDLVRLASQILGGGGGGKPDIAQGGGTDASKISSALLAITESLR
jgi:alanyl-tRNA synthetase